MEETNTQNDTALVSYIDGKSPLINEAKPAALLLTAEPVKSLKNDLDQISDMGPHLYAIFLGIRLHLQEDSHADRLRATLMRFNTPMRSASRTVSSCFRQGIRFYEHEGAEANRQGRITEGMVRRLLAPDFQARAIGFARKGMVDAATAAKMIREEVLPQLPRVKEDLEDYVSDYIARDALKRGQEKSWVPSLLRNAIEGRVDPTPWNVEEVREYPQRFATASNLLRRLPSFLDNVELHFRRLTEINSQQMLEHGYTTFNDLVRLYQDRLLCTFVLDEIDFSWFSADRAFGIGVVKDKYFNPQRYLFAKTSVHLVW